MVTFWNRGERNALYTPPGAIFLGEGEGGGGGGGGGGGVLGLSYIVHISIFIFSMQRKKGIGIYQLRILKKFGDNH